ncbi:MAG: phage tail protein [Lachnospiraceae bacterium]|nr:phage tail protein [Lachnospiraceae bacterium]
MAQYRKLIITSKGQALMSKLIAGTAIAEFTKVSTTADEFTDDDIPALEALTNVKQTVSISHIRRINDVSVEIEAALENSSLNEGYYINTIGLYAVDPDDGEILYAVAGATIGTYMPPYNGLTVSGIYLKLDATVSNAANVSLEVDPAAVATIHDIMELEISMDQVLHGFQEPIMTAGEDKITDESGNVICAVDSYVKASELKLKKQTLENEIKALKNFVIARYARR